MASRTRLQGLAPNIRRLKLSRPPLSFPRTPRHPHPVEQLPAQGRERLCLSHRIGPAAAGPEASPWLAVAAAPRDRDKFDRLSHAIDTSWSMFPRLNRAARGGLRTRSTCWLPTIMASGGSERRDCRSRSTARATCSPPSSFTIGSTGAPRPRRCRKRPRRCSGSSPRRWLRACGSWRSSRRRRNSCGRRKFLPSSTSSRKQ